jgi:hypothetical protein
MSELEPGSRSRRKVAPRHIPQVVVPVAPEDVREFMRDALRGTSILNPVTSLYAGWAFFEPHVRFTPVDASHTRIEIDVTSRVRGAETLFFVQRRAEIDRFFIAIEDELDRRERQRPEPPPFDKL